MPIKMTNKKKSKYGFTLIELILVILVVSLLMVYIIQLINESLLNAQVQKTVSEMFTIRNGALVYYAKNRVWPSDLSNDLIPDFLPANALCSPFLNTSGGSSTPCTGNKSSYVGERIKQYDGYYDLSLNLPSTLTANKLISVLPSSWIEGTTVHMAIPAPAVIQHLKNRGWIVSAGAVSLTANTGVHNIPFHTSNNDAGTPTISQADLGPQIFLPNCPQGYEGHLFVSPFNYQVAAIAPAAYSDLVGQGLHVAMVKVPHYGLNQAGSGYSPVTDQATITANTATSIVSYFENDNQTNPYPCNGNENTGPGTLCGFSLNPSKGGTPPISVITPKDSRGNLTAMVVTADALLPTEINHVAYFMTYCIPEGHWATNYIDPMWTQDAQCSASWVTYRENTVNSTPSCNIVGGTTGYYSSFDYEVTGNNTPYFTLNAGWNNNGQINDGSTILPMELPMELPPVGDTRAF